MKKLSTKIQSIRNLNSNSQHPAKKISISKIYLDRLAARKFRIWMSQLWLTQQPARTDLGK